MDFVEAACKKKSKTKAVLGASITNQPTFKWSNSKLFEGLRELRKKLFNYFRMIIESFNNLIEVLCLNIPSI